MVTRVLDLRKRSLLYVLAGMAVFASAATADVIVLKNGDRVTGSVVKKDAANLTFKSAAFGTITVPWDQVASLTTDTPVNAELASGQQIQGRVTTEQGRVQIGQVTAAPGDVKVLRNAEEQAAYERLLHPSWGRLWAGTATLGWAGTAGNAQTTTFAAGVNAARVTTTDRALVTFSAVKASALLDGVKSDTARAVRGGLAYNHNFSARGFVNAFNDWEFDAFQALDLRVSIGGGVGYTAWKSERGSLDLPIGMAWTHSKFDPAPQPKFTRNEAEAYWGDDFTYKASGRTSITQTFRMFDSVTDTGQYRVSFDLGVSTRIFKWLSWNLSASDRYLSNPANNRKTNDILYTTGIGVDFAR